MWAGIRNRLIPRLEPTERAYRTRLAQAAVRASVVLLALWLVVEVTVLQVIGPAKDHAFRFDLFAMLGLALALGAAQLLLRRDQPIAAGYLMAGSFFVYPLLNALLAPQDIYFINLTYVISILVAGSLVGGGPAYLFASMTIAASVASWIYARGHPAAQAFPFDLATGFIFIFALSLTALACAAVLDFFTSHMRRDLGQLNNQARQMTELAHTDPLTSLANRRYMMEQLKREFTRARRHRRPLSLIYLDLDGFKGINDHFGHLFGDEVLTGSARALLSVLRSTDLLARFGGDEFAVLLPETALEGAEKVAVKLRRALSAYGQQLGPAVQPLSFCAGVSQLHPDDTSIDDILARADEAQYLAKATGKGHTRFEYELANAGGKPG